MKEANYWAKKDGANFVRADHVTQAINEHVYRVNRIEERLREATLEDTLIIDTTGEKVGQVNGLAVLDMGDYSFGKPSRITARTYVGKAGIVNIERETKMSGKIHEKAIFIIASYLGRQVCRPEAHQPIRVDHLRAALRYDRGRQRDVRRDVRPAFQHLRRPPEAELRRDRLDGPERRRAAHRRASIKRSKGSSTSARAGGWTEATG